MVVMAMGMLMLCKDAGGGGGSSDSGGGGGGGNEFLIDSVRVWRHFTPGHSGGLWRRVLMVVLVTT
ncbi:hypothetical protein E2C01_050638 [Portunus trituberculatus]|uniref:Uncharacterized protein n=1 Tax=Portunus trituberculatus TaxID=210409 RepID=A0A5B7GH16_PORTR|nr:hypothetical protein [Portunus trituberculatus]